MANEQAHVTRSPHAITFCWRDRAITWISLAAITAIAWLYLAWMPMSSSDFGAFGARVLAAMTPGVSNAVLMFLMWTVMMVAMMLPSAAPMIDTYARIAHSGARPSSSFRVTLFAAGYLLAWTAFSAVATGVQLMLQTSGAINGALIAAPALGASILIVAGIYQLTPLKNLCLTKCRTPLGFLMTEWREGTSGAMRMGMRHGVMCIGCCWMLMLLLFVFGVMNLVWVAVLSIFVILEKSLPGGRIIARGSGIAMLAGGIALLI